MKEIIIFTLYFITIMLTVIAAAFLMFHHITGWGWFIFILFLIFQLNVKVAGKEE